MEVLFSIITLIGMGYAAFMGVKWMSRTNHISHKKSQPLSPTDLKVLEESAARLMADLKAAADECVARVEFTLAEAEHRMAALKSDRSSTISQQIAAPIQNPADHIDASDNSAFLSPQPGMTTGELELLQGLRQLAK